jgi:signal transduction histidine kinase
LYNLLETDQEKAWSQLGYEYPFDRFLNNTDETIIEKYKSLSEEALEEIKSFPSLFIYEDDIEENPYIGYITQIKKRHSSVYIEYKIIPDISISYSDILRLTKKLDINGYFATHRTYWAIKDEDLLAILKEEQLINEQQYSWILRDRVSDLEREGLEKRAALHKSERLAYLGQMATMMAHNINNPVGIIRMKATGAMQDIQEGLFDVNTELQPLLTSIIEQTERLNTLITNFRQFARGDRNTLSATPLNSLINDIYALLFAAPYQMDKIELQKDFIEPTPIAYSNEFALQEILISLLSNARAALQDKEDKAVLIRTWQENNQVGFDIEDSGEGILEEQRDKLFTPFLSSKQEGMGLGLYFCKEICKDLGGNIDYYPAPQGGAVFRITLPIQQDNEHGTQI